jgi:hypothetical protein
VRSAAKENQGKSKEKALESKDKILGLSWFYSSDSGLFNGLRRIQIKNSLSFRPPRRGACAEAFISTGDGSEASTSRLTRISGFGKELFENLCNGDAGRHRGFQATVRLSD